MASSDYDVRAEGGFCPSGKLGAAIGHGNSTITITGFKSVSESDLEVGMAVMVNGEVMRLQSAVLPTLSVLRGCADTVPVPHAVNSTVWFFSNAAISDEREYLATDTLGVKVLPFTAASGPMSIEYSPPLSLTFNWRFVRPYPPGRVRVNDEPLQATPFSLGLGETEFVITWAHRDRLLQADQLIGHEEASIGPEVGTTYTAQVYDADNNLVRTVSGISDTTWTYTETMLDTDIPEGVGRIELFSVRDTFESLQRHVIYIQKAGGLGESLGENLGG